MKKNIYFKEASSISVEKLADLQFGCQDGAIWGDYLFLFNTLAECRVFNFNDLSFVCEFNLDKRDLICPHSNAVVFGCEYYKEGDEFPLLYSNIYNNYEKIEGDRREGMVCVYRITREEKVFKSTLVQLIKIDFTNSTLWRSENCNDKRPFGNFVIDRENKKLFAFTMKDQDCKTRFFSFSLPKLSDGEYSTEFNLPVVTLGKQDIKECFDCEYIHFMQGAAYHDRYIYTTEGFYHDAINHPAIRVFDIKEQKQVLYIDLIDLGLNLEAEFIDIYEGKTYYIDGVGNVFKIIFE